MSVKLGTFTVPVDLPTLQACRMRRGYMSARQLDGELRRLGYALNYRQVEQPGRSGKEKRIQSATADIIAYVLGMEPDEVFPRYSAAKAATERAQAQGRYKPFTSTEERDRAIIDHYEVARRAAHSFAGILRNTNTGCLYVDMDDLYSLALDVLVVEADKAFHFGILKGYDFTTQLILSIKTAFLRLRAKEMERRRFLTEQSLEAYTESFQIPSAFDLEEYIIAREELRERLTTLSDK